MSNGNQKKNQNQNQNLTAAHAPPQAPEPVSHGGYDGGSSSSSAAPKSVKAASGPLELKNGMTIKALPRFTVQVIAPDGAVPIDRIVYAASAEDAQEQVKKELNM